MPQSIRPFACLAIAVVMTLVGQHNAGLADGEAGTSLDPARPVDKIVIDAEDALNKASGFSPTIVKSDSGSTEVDDAGEIVVNESQLTSLQTRAGAKLFPTVVRLVLAHEYGHLFQREKYGASYTTSADDDDLNRAYELQADIFAGEYLVLQADAVGTDQTEVQDDILDALQVMFDLGVGPQSDDDASYPTPEERRAAIRIGMAAGMMTFLQAASDDPRFQESADILRRKIDAVGATDSMAWSLKEAKKVGRFRQAAVDDVDLDSHGESSITYDHNPNHPFVHFELTYKNSGSETASVDLDVQSLSVLRSDVHDTKHDKLTDSKEFTFTLAAGASKTLSGDLLWFGDATYEPRLEFPPLDEGSLMSVVEH